MGDVAANWALTQLGKPYVWAADGPDSFDCSGLTMRAWEQAGVGIDHWTGTQWTSGPHVPLDQLRRGDLLFFGYVTDDPGTIHHVGMYVGRRADGARAADRRRGAGRLDVARGPGGRHQAPVTSVVSPRPWRAGRTA